MDKKNVSRYIKITIAVILFITAGAIAIKRLQPVPQVVHAVWFYDLNSHQLFPAQLSELPPIHAPGAPNDKTTGVRAMVFSCGDCTDASARKIAWFEVFAADAKEQYGTYDALNEVSPDQLSPGSRMVRREKDKEWADFNTPEGAAIRATPKCPDGTMAKNCVP